MRSILLILGTSGLLASCAWEPQQHPGHGSPPNVISGEVVANGVTTPSTTIIFVASADNPMPPLGTGRPATFSSVPASEYTGQSAGLQSASYAVTGVPDGDYLITGFMDVDGDFHPTVDALSGATCGDIGGAHLADLQTGTLAAVSVSGGELLDDVTIVLGSTFTVERPAFYPLAWNETAGAYVPGMPVVSIGRAVAGAYETFKVASTAVHAAYRNEDDEVTLTYDLEGPYEVQGDRWDPYLGTPTCEVAFFGWVKDSDENGVPDEHPDYPGTGLLDIWPRFGLTFLGDPVDTNSDGFPDAFENDLATGESWSSPAAVSPLSVLLTGELPVGVPFLTDLLDVLYVPAAAHTYPASESDCLGDWANGLCTETVLVPSEIPRGAWALTVISETGQTWTVPNTLPLASSTDTDTFNPLTQFTWVWVTD